MNSSKGLHYSWESNNYSSIAILSILNRFSWNAVKQNIRLNIASKMMICVTFNASGLIYSPNKISHVQTWPTCDRKCGSHRSEHLTLSSITSGGWIWQAVVRFCSHVHVEKPPTWFVLICRYCISSMWHDDREVKKWKRHWKRKRGWQTILMPLNGLCSLSSLGNLLAGCQRPG